MKKKRYVTKFPYRYNEAYDYLNKIDAKKNVIMFGNYYYSFLPHIIENYNFNDLKKIILIRADLDLKIGLKESIADRITKTIFGKKKIIDNYENRINLNNYNIAKQISINDEIQYILITNYKKTNKKELIKNLKLFNWIVEKEFYEKQYKTKLLLFRKIDYLKIPK